MGYDWAEYFPSNKQSTGGGTQENIRLPLLDIWLSCEMVMMRV